MMLALGFTSGAFWPTETWPTFWQQVSQYHPLTLPLKSLSSSMTRGWHFHNINVLKGQLVGIVYCFILISVAIIVFQFKNRRFK